MDLVLSSGFLAFASQAGFLAAVQEEGVDVGGVCGTSSGALAAAGFAAGLDRDELLDLLCGARPFTFLRPSLTPWRGAFSLRLVVRMLRERLPATFEGLDRPLGVGIRNERGEAELVRSGPLAEAVVASMSIPRVFEPTRLGGRLCADGGVVDRTALSAWRRLRPDQDVLLHLLEPTGTGRWGSAPSGDPGDDAPGVRVVRSPRSGASFFSLGDVQGRYEAARARTLAALRESA